MLGGGVGTHACRERGSEGAGRSAGLREGALMRRLEGVEGPCSTSVGPLALRGLKSGESGGRERRRSPGLVASLAGLKAPLWERMALLGGFR